MKDPKDSTILVVDDEADLRDAIAFDFKRIGYRVLTASSGNEAFGLLEQNKIDVILSDVRMPNGDGIALLDRVKARNVHLPVVMFITGYADISLEEAYAKGADAVFPKPFDRKALFDSVTHALLPFDVRPKRASTRVNIEVPVALKFLKSNVNILSKASNLGCGGFFVVLDDQFPQLEECEFGIDSAFTPVFRISGTGIVRWVRNTSLDPNYPLGCGIEFTSLEQSCLVQMIELINSLKTNSLIPRK